MTELHRSMRHYFVTLILASFALNWFWEMAQMNAYVEMAGKTWSDTYWLCTVATMGDVAITLIIYGIGALASSQIGWGMSGRWNVYATGAALGGAAAVVIEWRALTSGKWSYTDAMPILPIVKVGLWPFLQLLVLVPGSFAFGYWWQKRRGGPNPH